VIVRAIFYHCRGSHFSGGQLCQGTAIATRLVPLPGCLHCMSFLCARTMHLPVRTLPSFACLPAAAGLDQSSSSRPAPSTGFRDLQGNCNTREEAVLEARHIWHNALSFTVLHGSTPGDPQTIPTCVPSSVPCAFLQQYN